MLIARRWLVALVLLILAIGISGAARADDAPLPGLPNEAAVKAFEMGERLLKAGKPEEAAQAFDEAARLAPLFHLAHYAAGNALASTGKTREAEKRYRECVAVAPSFATGWNALGVVLLSGDRLADALDAFDRALRADPEHLLARIHRAEALISSGRAADGEKDVRLVLERHADHADALVVLARAMAVQGRIEQGHATLVRVLKASPDHAAAWLLQASLYATQKDLPKALVSLETVIAKAGDNAGVRNQAARIAAAIAEQARGRGEARSQVKALDLLSTLAPRAPGVWARLGAALITLYETRAPESRDPHEIERARKALERSLELDPDQANVKELLEMYRDA